MALPAWSLRGLTLLTRVDTTDAYGASVPGSWIETVITGYVEQRTRGEDHSDGRRAEESGWFLATNSAAVTPGCRVRCDAGLFDVIGAPAPWYRGKVIHHYEVTLRLVNG